MTRPTPALNPVSTGSEMKFARNPSRTMRAIMSIAPTRKESVAAAVNALSDESERELLQLRWHTGLRSE